MNSKTQKMVGLALMTAIVVILQLLTTGLHALGLFSLTFALVPIVVGAAVYDWKAGAWLGFVFGAMTLLDASAFLAVSVPGTVITVLAKGTLCGLCAGLMYRAMHKWNRTVAVIASAVVCPLVNTGVFLLGCRVFFFETLKEWGAGAGFTNVVAYMMIGLVGANFFIELAMNVILSPIITRLIQIREKS